MPSKSTKRGARHGVHKREGPRGTTWHAVVDLGVDPDSGKRKQKRLSASTKTKLEEDIADLIARNAKGAVVADSKVPVSEFLEQWLESITTRVRPSTRRAYAERIRLFISPKIGMIQMGKLAPIDVQKLTVWIVESGRTSSTANSVHGVLRAALNDAVRWGIVPRNVASAVHAPRPEHVEMQTWNPTQVAHAFRELAGDRLECLIRLAITTGMRRGELLGLRWIDVDIDRKQLSIRHTLVRDENGRWESGTPKTAKSRRSISLSDDDVAMLIRHKDRQEEARLAAGDDWQESGLVFTEPNGKAIYATGLARRFEVFIARTGLPRIRFHDLRHTAASLMLSAGEHPKIVQERLGHSSISMTLDRYSHVTSTMQEAAAERLERLIRDAS